MLALRFAQNRKLVTVSPSRRERAGIRTRVACVWLKSLPALGKSQGELTDFKI